MNWLLVVACMAGLAVYKLVVFSWLARRFWDPALNRRTSSLQAAFWTVLFGPAGLPIPFVAVAMSLGHSQSDSSLIMIAALAWSVTILGGTLMLRAVMEWEIAHPSRGL